MPQGVRHSQRDFCPRQGDACAGAGGAITELSEVLGNTGSALRPVLWASTLSKTFNPLCCFCMVCLSIVPLTPNLLSSYPALCPRRLTLTDCITQTLLPSGFRSRLNNGRHQEEPEIRYGFPAVFLSSISSALSTVD